MAVMLGEVEFEVTRAHAPYAFQADLTARTALNPLSTLAAPSAVEASRPLRASALRAALESDW